MIGKILGNRYEIIERIGGGGMALVYKAKCKLLNRYVAVKILRPEFTSDEDFISKFKGESQAAASLSHSNIVNIYDVGNEDNDIYYIVMEYVKGKTLKQIIKEEGPLEPEKIVNIGKQIALALQHAHSNHIVHRDIKPHNILITDDGRVRVTDFGIARAATSSTVTNVGNVIGSVHYFSPEQARGGYVDEKSDLYSLGIVIYEMATGKVPFEGESPISIALKHIHENVVPPSIENKNVPKAIEDIILKAVQKDQVKRYNSAKEILEDLNQALKYPMGDFVKYQDDDDCPTQIIPAITDEDLVQDQMSMNKPKTNKKNDRFIVWGAITAAFILALIVTGSIFYFKDMFVSQEKEVPSLVGLAYEDAKTNLENIGLKAEVAGEQYSSEYEKGHVIKQDPAFGEIRKSGFPVGLTVSKGSKIVEVPNLVQKNIEEIDILLQNAKLKEGMVKYEYSSLPVGTIMRQSPDAFIKAPEGTKIDIFVSQGPETKTILMPDLVGQNIENAKKTIETSGLILGNTTYKYDEVDKDQVIFQSISSGTEIEEKETVSLTVSKGPENIEQLPEEEEFQMKSVSFNVYYDQAKREEFQLKIVKIQNGVSTQIYEDLRQKSKTGEKITIQGRDNAEIEIYFDNEFITTKKIDFETGKIYD